VPTTDPGVAMPVHMSETGMSIVVEAAAVQPPAEEIGEVPAHGA
jgi:hypothetical protein